MQKNEIINQNIIFYQQKIVELALKYNRNPQNIKLIAVTKGQNVEAIEAAYSSGVRDFGENYIQEYISKKNNLSHLSDINWHLIGNIQKNKIKYLQGYCIHSINKLDLLQEISAYKMRNPNVNICSNILVQLQIDSLDENKSGATISEAVNICKYLQQNPSFSWHGFMGMGPVSENPIELSNLYENFIKNCNNLWHEFQQNSTQAPQISLGMTQDLEQAIQAGATLVRIGTGIFGKRSYKKD